MAYQEELTGKIDENEQKIDQARATIEEMNGKIQELQARLDLSEEEHQGTIDAFKERLKALYVSGGSSLGTLEILLDSSSLSEFFTRQELVEVIWPSGTSPCWTSWMPIWQKPRATGRSW